MWNDPEVFGGFLLVQRLAESAMATVHLAVRLGDASGRPLVLKKPPLGERPSGRAAQAILREAEVLGEVRGAGIPALEAAGDIAGLPYVAVERLRGASLAKLIALGEPLPAAAVRAVGKDIARALTKLAAAGWVHRDVTPSNLFIDDAGEAYLLDYGLAARAGDERGADVAGTRGYAAPEAAVAGSAHPSRDVYGLAVCLAEAALGRRIFDESSLVEAAGRGDAPPQVALLEPQLPGLGAALRRDPSARPSAADLAAGLGDETDRDTLAARVQTAAAPRQSLPPTPAATAAGSASKSPSAAGSPAVTLPVQNQPAPPAGSVAPLVTPIERSGTATPIVALAPAAVGPPKPFAPHALTPTAGMPAVADRESGVLPTLRDPASPPPVYSPAPRAPASIRAPASRASASRLPALVAVLLVLVALAAGFFAGRLTSRARGSSFAITGALPKRSEVYLDGKKLTFADGVPMPVPPGPHTITIVPNKGAKREIPFTVRSGEHVVVLSPPRPAGTGAPDDDGP